MDLISVCRAPREVKRTGTVLHQAATHRSAFNAPLGPYRLMVRRRCPRQHMQAHLRLHAWSGFREEVRGNHPGLQRPEHMLNSIFTLNVSFRSMHAFVLDVSKQTINKLGRNQRLRYGGIASGSTVPYPDCHLWCLYTLL